MLVLNRKSGEQIVIGDGPDAVTITLVAMRGERASIGVKAPASVRVLRAELIGPQTADGAFEAGEKP